MNEEFDTPAAEFTLEEIGDLSEVTQGPGIILNDGPHLLRGFP